MNSFRTIAFATMIVAAPLAGAAAGQGGSDIGTHIYSPSPLIVQTDAARQVAALPHHRRNPAQRPVRIADAGSVGTSIYQPGPATTTTRHERLIAGINEAYGTSFATHAGNRALAMNDR